MISLIIFDLDGVLVDSRELHYESLNIALREVSPHFAITHQEHLAKYDGLPTKDKLLILTKDKQLPVAMYDQIKKRKQEVTLALIQELTTKDDKLNRLFGRLKADGYLVYVASNAVRSTIEVTLENKGVRHLVDLVLSNEDVKLAKPNPEIYLRAMVAAGVGPKQTLIVEDSYVGRSAVFNSGAHLCPVQNPSDLTLEKVYAHLRDLNSSRIQDKWPGGKMNVLIPMAGAGSRFAKAGYTFPKPLIEVRGKPMIQVVVENLGISANYTYVVQREHYDKYNLKYLLNMITPNCNIVCIEGVTEGAACTTLLAKQFIDNEEPLLIANSDQFVEWTPGEFYHSMNSLGIDGGILTFKNTHPKWSYVKLDEHGNVTEVVEKKVVSDIATVGIYYWTKGSEYVKYAEQMIRNNKRQGESFNGKGEFYCAPVYNEAVADGAKIKIFNIQSMHSLGTPEDLNLFLQTDKGAI